MKKTKATKKMFVPIRYLPKNLTKNDTKRQIKMLIQSRKKYKKKQYITRKNLASYKSKTSKHIVKARKLYKVKHISPSKELALATGCSITTLRKIVKKGEGAYFSSGSRPNQTPQSWGIARLASALTGGPAAKVDAHLLEGCVPSRRYKGNPHLI